MPRTLKANPKLTKSARIMIMSYLRFLMLKNDISYRDLARKFNEVGYEENERNLRNKVSKGEMQAWYFLLCLRFLGAKSVSIEDVPLHEAELLHGVKSDAPVESK